MRALRPAHASWPANRVARLRLLWRRGLSTAEIGRLRFCQQPHFWTRQATGWSSRRPAPRFRRASDGVPVADRSGPPTAAPSCASFGTPSTTRRLAASSTFPWLQSSARRSLHADRIAQRVTRPSTKPTAAAIRTANSGCSRALPETVSACSRTLSERGTQRSFGTTHYVRHSRRDPVSHQ